MAEERERLVSQAQMAEQADRYEDMVDIMKKLVSKCVAAESGLKSDERNLLSVAYKNVVGAKRSAWRVLSNTEQKAEDDTEKRTMAKEYRERISKEVADVCTDLLDLVNEYLLPSVGDDAHGDKAFFHKMKGDYYRYIAEVSVGAERVDAVEKSEKAYESATDNANPHLQATDQVRLGLALNYSVFHYEIKNDSDAACKLAKRAFDEAIALVDTLDEGSYKDTTLIMQLLRDNLMLWTADQEEADEGANPTKAEEEGGKEEA